VSGRKKTIEIPSLDQLDSERKRLRYRKGFRRSLRSTLAVLIVIAAISVLVATLWLPVLQIYGSSMEPTLQEGELLVVIKGRTFETGDPVAFYYGNKLLVKRVIAGPGDILSIDENGLVTVNEVPLEEEYVEELCLGTCDLEFPLQVEEDKWFLMGDNRAVSVDSRSSSIGCISDDQILGKAVFRFWPVGRIGGIR